MADDEWSEFQLLSYFQTSLRNVGLYTSLAFAALTAGRYYDKISIRRKIFVGFGIIYISLTLFLLKNMRLIKNI